MSLIDKSLVFVDHTTPLRYRQLEMIRQYGEDRLVRRNETDSAADRYLAYYVAWLEEADRGSRGPEELRWHHSFRAEWGNVRGGFNRAVATGDLDAACSIVWHTHWWARTRARFEVGEWADLVLALPGAETHPLSPTMSAISAMAARHKLDWSAFVQRLEDAERQEDRNGPALEPWTLFERGFVEAMAVDAATLPSTSELWHRAAGSPFWESAGGFGEPLDGPG